MSRQYAICIPYEFTDAQLNKHLLDIVMSASERRASPWPALILTALLEAMDEGYVHELWHYVEVHRKIHAQQVMIPQFIPVPIFIYKN